MTTDIDTIAIAIDGPAASGKSTVAKQLAKKLGLIMVNTGAMYRSIAWATLHYGVDAHCAADVIEMLKKVKLTCGVEDGVSTIIVDGISPGEELRKDPVNEIVSTVAQISEVREMLVEKQREYLKLGSLVMEGRDIGSVVFPDTPYKFYIDASLEVRAARRGAEGIVDALADRDKQDSERKISPLKVASGAIKIDTSEMTVDEVLAEILTVLKQKGAPKELLQS
ncbi:(d)CMP kinase [Akkermansiaceae bacterium]|nr:(d)CMP kinase [Akkermansiaceae bacterium]